MFGKLLGKTDKKGQISEIDLSLNFIENQIQHAEFEKNKSTKRMFFSKFPLPAQ